MAFDRDGLALASVGKTSLSVPQLWVYRNTADTLSDILTSGYLNPANANQPIIQLDDRFYLVGSDGKAEGFISAVSPNINITQFSVAAGSVDQAALAKPSVGTPELFDGAVNDIKIAAPASVDSAYPFLTYEFNILPSTGAASTTYSGFNFNAQIVDAYFITDAAHTDNTRTVQVFNDLGTNNTTEALPMGATGNAILRFAQRIVANSILTTPWDLTVSRSIGGGVGTDGGCQVFVKIKKIT